MKNIVIIGANPIGYELAAAMHDLLAEQIEIQQKQQNEDFGIGHLRIKNYELEMIQCPNYYEHQTSKFISKPKNNFKRR